MQKQKRRLRIAEARPGRPEANRKKREAYWMDIIAINSE
jgi:hypothetical protein